MTWNEVRTLFPGKWLVIEALSAHSAGGLRVVGDLVVLGAFLDAAEAQRKQLSLHRTEPAREILLVCAEWETLEIQETRWAGIRKADENPARRRTAVRLGRGH